MSPRRKRASIAFGALAALVAEGTAEAATYYVAPTGSDAASGSQSAPFASWAHAQSVAAPGDTVYFRGGTYRYTDATATCSSATATVDAVVLDKSGTAGSPIRYWAFPGETPVFDFSGISDATKYACRHVGVRVTAAWLHLKGLELKGSLQLNDLNHESWGLYVYGGSNDIFELIDSHHHMGPGFFLQRGGNNLFLNCDSHENEDTLTSNGDGQSADGFGCHPDRKGDTGNVFRGCRAWWNSDDAWDFINAQEACTVEYSWAWYSGYKPDAVSNGQPVPLAAGNGNGFKAGGYGDPQTNVPTPAPQHVVRFDAAFYNKANGLYANHGIVNAIFYNNTSFDNGVDVNMLGLDGTTVTSVGLLRNNLAFSPSGRGMLSDMTHGGPIDDAFNSWDAALGVTVTAADFESLDFAAPASCPAPFSAGGTPCVSPTDTKTFAGMASARAPDGSLPVLPFLRLAATSALVDKGVDVGLPYVGKAPDLGAFEVGASYDGSDGGAPMTSSSSVSAAPSSSGATSSAAATASAASVATSSGSGAGTASSAGGVLGSVVDGGSSRAPGSASADSSGASSAPMASPAASSAAGCGCRIATQTSGGQAVASLGLLALARLRRRRRAKAGRAPAS